MKTSRMNRRLISIWTLTLLLIFGSTACSGIPTNTTMPGKSSNTSDKHSYVYVNPDKKFLRFNEVLKTYDKKIIPSHGGHPLMVKVEAEILSFGPISEGDQQFSFEMFFRQWWRDEKLTGALNETLTMACDAGDLIWKPDTCFRNTKEASFQTVTKKNSRTIIQPNGNIYNSLRVSMTAFCSMSFRKFPMDNHVCTVTIESYSYPESALYYKWNRYNTSAGTMAVPGIQWENDVTEGPIFHLTRIETVDSLTTFSQGHFSQLQLKFYLKRNNGYYIWFIYLPSTLLVIMAFTSFWVPSHAHPARVTLAVTTFLSTLFLMDNAGKQLRRVSYLKALDVFAMGNAGFIFMTLMEYVIVLSLREQSAHKKVSSSDLGTHSLSNSIISNKIAEDQPNLDCNQKNSIYQNENPQRKTPELENEEGSDCCDGQQRNRVIHKSRMLEEVKTSYFEEPTRIDLISRYFFPIIYVAFIAIYVTYYHIV